jgi:hypothetical protein
MEVMRPDLASFRVATSVVEPRSHSALHGFDDFLVFHLDAMQSRSNSTFA